MSVEQSNLCASKVKTGSRGDLRQRVERWLSYIFTTYGVDSEIALQSTPPPDALILPAIEYVYPACEGVETWMLA